MRTFVALVVMFALPFYLPVLPVPGLPGLLAGGLGGYLAGRPGRALLLALLPLLVLAVAIAAIGVGVGLPLIGSAIAGIALLWLLFEHVALLVGAAIGGAIAARRNEAARTAEPAPSSPRATAARSADALPPAEPARPALERPDGPPHREAP